MSGVEWLLDTNMVIGLLKGHDAAIEFADQKRLILDTMWRRMGER